MSDRTAVPTKEIPPQWIRSIEDRLRRLEQRKLQGTLSMSNIGVTQAAIDTATIKNLSGGIMMTGTAPVKMQGSRTWTQSIEKLGNGDSPGCHAMVTRDDNGQIVDIFPKPHIQLTGAAVVAIPTGVRTVVPASALAKSYSLPYTFDQTYDDTQGAIIMPAAGFWMFFCFSTWALVADATARVVVPQVSSNQGGTWSDHYTDTKAAVATDAATHTFPFGTQSYGLNQYFRMTAFHRSVTTPINYTQTRFTAMWMRGNPI